MSLPFFDALHKFLPNIRVDILAKKSILDVYAFHPAITTSIPFAKTDLRGVFGGFYFGRALQAQHGYDAFLTLTPSFSSAFIGYGVGARYRLGYKNEARSIFLTHRFTPTRGVHLAQNYYELLDSFCRIVRKSVALSSEEVLPNGLPPFTEARTTPLRFPFSDQERRSSFLTKQPNTEYILCNVNSEAQSRRLPVEKWIALGKRLLDDTTTKRCLVFSGIPAEMPRVQRVKDGLDRPSVILDYSGKTSLRELAMLLRDVDLVISNDSGPMHLANAVGTPLLTFLGAANPVVTEPFNSEKTLVLNKFLECSPCVKNVCRFSTVRCLEQITIDELFKGAITLLNDRGDEGQK